MKSVYFEDLRVGQCHESHSYRFTEQEIMEYCGKYDPQIFHINHEAAAQSIFRGIVASGFHTLAVAFRLFMDLKPFGESNMGGFAIDDVRLLKPVRDGDEIRVKSEIVDARESTTKADRGVVHVSHEVVNQTGTVVARFKVGHLVRRIPA